MIIKRPSVSRKVLKASLMMYLSFGDMLGPCLGGFGGLLAAQYFSTGLTQRGLPFPAFIFLFPLTINHHSEGRRREITAMFLVLVPAGLGGCYFRLNQLPAGSLDEMPPHENLLEVSPLGGFPQ